MTLSIQNPTHLPGVTTQNGRDLALRRAAEQLESAFLSEMLGAAGLGKSRETFGGGAGEEQFASFLRTAQADHMVQAGGIGLAERLFQALKGDRHVS